MRVAPIGLMAAGTPDCRLRLLLFAHQLRRIRLMVVGPVLPPLIRSIGVLRVPWTHER
jgi:hypothetical protein